jgi:hypothetical protein
MAYSHAFTYLDYYKIFVLSEASKIIYKNFGKLSSASCCQINKGMTACLIQSDKIDLFSAHMAESFNVAIKNYYLAIFIRRNSN